MKNKISFRLSKELEEKIRKKAIDDSVVYSSIIIKALELYFSQNQN